MEDNGSKKQRHISAAKAMLMLVCTGLVCVAGLQRYRGVKYPALPAVAQAEALQPAAGKPAWHLQLGDVSGRKIFIGFKYGERAYIDASELCQQPGFRAHADEAGLVQVNEQAGTGYVMEAPDITLPGGLAREIWWVAVGYFLRDEVEVWDVESKKALFAVPSKRTSGNLSGLETLFSADGKYLVVQDFFDTKNGEPKFPRIYDDPAELPAQQDKNRYILARVWDLEQRKEIAQLRGPGSRLYGGSQDGFCQTTALPGLVVVHRQAVVALYEIATGKFVAEVNARNPFADKPDQRRGYWRMSCQPLCQRQHSERRQWRDQL